jgi:predicted RNA-binding Zn ribbon-like protein
MQLARNMRRVAELAAELVNAATPGNRGGRPHPAAGGGELTGRFAALLSPAWAAQVSAVPDAGQRLAQMAAGFQQVFDASDLSKTAAIINELLRRYRAQPYLAEDTGRAFHLHFHGEAETPVESLGAELVIALAHVIDTYGQNRFGRCEATRCDGVYVDLTRNGSRRYCSEACSARAKTAAYRHRQDRMPDS